MRRNSPSRDCGLVWRPYSAERQMLDPDSRRDDVTRGQEIVGPVTIYHSKSFAEFFLLKYISELVGTASRRVIFLKAVKAPRQLPLGHGYHCSWTSGR